MDEFTDDPVAGSQSPVTDSLTEFHDFPQRPYRHPRATTSATNEQVIREASDAGQSLEGYDVFDFDRQEDPENPEDSSSHDEQQEHQQQDSRKKRIQIRGKCCVIVIGISGPGLSLLGCGSL